jgi:hypothetical protein
MDNIWSPTSLGLFLTFFVPGFIAQKVYGLIVPDEERDSASFIVSAIAYSSLNYAIAAPFVWALWASGRLNNLYIDVPVLAFVLLILPTLLPIAWLWIRRRPWVQSRTLSPIKRPWDFVFGRRREYWVLVTLKDGEKIGGIYGRQSSSSSYPRQEQIYLEKVWILGEDNTFVHEAPQSKGVIILGDEIAYIELFSSPEGSHG